MRFKSNSDPFISVISKISFIDWNYYRRRPHLQLSVGKIIRRHASVTDETRANSGLGFGPTAYHGAVIFAWPSRETVLQVWRSDEYADVRKLREGAAEFQSILVEETLPTAGGPLP
jgi:uncharacterized protein (DUF1330 family)